MEPTPQAAEEVPTSLPSPPPAKRVKVDTSIQVNVNGDNVTFTQAAFNRLEGFMTEKVNSSEKKVRYHSPIFCIMCVPCAKEGKTGIP